MRECPKCGERNDDAANYCIRCGTMLSGLPESQATSEISKEDEVKGVIVKRLNGIRDKNEEAVRGLIDERYSKFDDWPPFTRQGFSIALQNEFGAFKVLTRYEYELRDFQVKVFGEMAIGTFVMHYTGVIRDSPFDITSRVTSVLLRQSTGWKVVHEHFSRFPQERDQQQFMRPRRRRWGL
jgi:ketosteroid isomerase-like protein